MMKVNVHAHAPRVNKSTNITHHSTCTCTCTCIKYPNDNIGITEFGVRGLGRVPRWLLYSLNATCTCTETALLPPPPHFLLPHPGGVGVLVVTYTCILGGGGVHVGSREPDEYWDGECGTRWEEEPGKRWEGEPGTQWEGEPGTRWERELVHGLCGACHEHIRIATICHEAYVGLGGGGEGH